MNGLIECFRADEWIGPSQAAARLGCSTGWVKILAERGVLRSLVTPLGRLINVADIDRYVHDRTATQ